ncbi:MAG: ATP-binding cassette domain-containing protein [Anaerolineales bacterium]|nr:ATP-binding cassette domain-containing protein [Anaerolineales bacterium]
MSDIALQATMAIATPDFTIEITFEAGPDLVVIFGPSGSGKSLTLKALAGLIQPEEGTIRLGNRILFDKSRGIHLPPQQRKVGYVPQDYALFPHLTIAENIAFGLHDVSRKERSIRVHDLLHLLRLDAFAQRKPTQVSGGQKQRAALARALARQPDILLLDEPFGALDEALRSHVRDEIRRIQTYYQIPVILVSHSLEDAYSLADHLIVVSRGRVIQAGAKDEVFRRPTSPDVARLTGMVNILEAQVESFKKDQVVVNWAGHKLSVFNMQSINIDQQALMGIRPEDVMFVRETISPDDAKNENLLRCVIVDDRAQGFDHLLTVVVQHRQSSGKKLLIRMPHPIYLGLGLATGQERTIFIEPSSIHLFPDQVASPREVETD